MELVIYEYQEKLLGNIKIISSQNSVTRAQAEIRAKKVLKYAVEKLLRWTPEEMAKKFNKEVIKKMKLEEIIYWIPFPAELDPDKDFYYYAYYLYPAKIAYDFRQSVIFTYRKLLASYLLGEKKDEYDTIKNETLKNKLVYDGGYRDIVDQGITLFRFPKEYLNEAEGHLRAGICMQYMLKEFYNFKSIYEMYEFFADPAKSVQAVKDCKLFKTCSDLYNSPLDYLHDALPHKQKSDLLYSMYRFMELEKKKKK